MFMERDCRQLFFYIVVGIMTAVIDISTMQATLYFSKNILFALTLSYIASVVFNFVCHSKITFSFGITIRVIYKYLTVVFFNYFLTVILVYFFVHLDFDALIGKIFSLPIVALIGFVLSKHWIFK